MTSYTLILPPKLHTRVLKELKKCPVNGYLVFSWQNAPRILCETFNCSGGDEDWLVIMQQSTRPDWDPRWLQAISTCGEPDEYFIGDYVVLVGTHA